MAQFLNGIRPNADIERNSLGFLNGQKRSYLFSSKHWASNKGGHRFQGIQGRSRK
jgi:hypothetical protein